MSLDFSRCRLKPFQHQAEDTEWLLQHPYAFIASEMRTGKTKIVIDAAHFLYERGLINKMIVIAPAPVRDVWCDPEIGELQKHFWRGTNHRIVEFHSQCRLWFFGDDNMPRLDWYVTNYEFLRSKARLDQLMAATGPKTWLVLDESSFVKSHGSQQTKACMILRKRCGRVTLINGTPIFHSPQDLFSQGNLIHHSILSCPYITQFKALYALERPVMKGGKPLKVVVGKGPYMKEIVIKETVGWQNLDDLQKRFAPYTVRRLQKDCADMPDKLEAVNLTATLTPDTWRAYRNMRDDLVVWFKSGKAVTSATAAVKTLRLAQITGGFLGGAAHVDLGENNDWIADQPEALEDQHSFEGFTAVGREKLDVLLWFIGSLLEQDPNLHVVVWHRFRAEAYRTFEEVKKAYPQFTCGIIAGSQTPAQRAEALALLKPETSPAGPVFVAGIEGTGSFGLDMTAAHTCISMSSGYSHGRVAQTLDRVYGPGQKHPIAYYNIIAVGPKGQRTIDHEILLSRTSGEDLANRTADVWVRALDRLDEEGVAVNV